YLAHCADVSDADRHWAQAAIAGQFALHELVKTELGTGPVYALIVQNIADGQGDEIIRVVPLLEALLSFNPQLEVVLITKQTYLYTHSRVTLVPIDDRDSVT